MVIKFITLNIWRGGIFFDKVVRFLQEEKPDILFLQEVYNGKDRQLEKRFRTFAILKKQLGYPYAIFAPAFIDTRKEGNIERGNATFSQFPIVASKVIFYDTPFSKFDEEHDKANYEYIPMNLLRTTMVVGDKNIIVLNTHGIWGLNGMDNKRRIAMSETIVSEVKGKEYVILAGDFNMLSNTQTIGNIEKHLMSVFKNRLKTTFNTQVKKGGGFAEAAVDMVFVSKQIKVLEYTCPQINISDHLPLICRLEL